MGYVTWAWLALLKLPQILLPEGQHLSQTRVFQHINARCVLEDEETDQDHYAQHENDAYANHGGCYGSAAEVPGALSHGVKPPV